MPALKELLGMAWHGSWPASLLTELGQMKKIRERKFWKKKKKKSCTEAFAEICPTPPGLGLSVKILPPSFYWMAGSGVYLGREALCPALGEKREERREGHF